MLVSKCITMSCFFHTTLLSYPGHTQCLTKDTVFSLRKVSLIEFLLSQRNGSFRVELRKGMTHIRHIFLVLNPLQFGNLAPQM